MINWHRQYDLDSSFVSQCASQRPSDFVVRHLCSNSLDRNSIDNCVALCTFVHLPCNRMKLTVVSHKLERDIVELHAVAVAVAAVDDDDGDDVMTVVVAELKPSLIVDDGLLPN